MSLRSESDSVENDYIETDINRRIIFLGDTFCVTIYQILIYWYTQEKIFFEYLMNILRYMYV